MTVRSLNDQVVSSAMCEVAERWYRRIMRHRERYIRAWIANWLGVGSAASR